MSKDITLKVSTPLRLLNAFATICPYPYKPFEKRNSLIEITVSESELRSLLDCKDYSVLSRLGGFDDLPIASEPLNSVEVDIIRKAIAKSPHTPSHILAELATADDHFIRAYVAENSNTPADVLERLSEDKEDLVLIHVACNPNTPIDALLKLCRLPLSDPSDDTPVQSFLVMEDNPNYSRLPKEDIQRVLVTLSQSNDRENICDVMLNPNTPIDLIRSLFNRLLSKNGADFLYETEIVNSLTYISQFPLEQRNIFNNGLIKPTECSEFFNAVFDSMESKGTEMQVEETNLLVPFLSDCDEKLKVSSLDPNTKIPIVQTDPNLDINYFDAREMIDNLPRLLPESDTPEGVGELRISNRSKQKLINEIGNYESELREAYLNVTPYIIQSIQDSLLLEEHRDRVKGLDGSRFYSNAEDPNINKIQRLYGAINLKGNLYRLKTTLQVFRDEKDTGKYHGYEVTEIGLLSPKLRNIAKPAIDVALNNNSISLAKLLKDVELSYEPNVKLLDAMGACHELKVTGNSESMRRVYEEARTKRLLAQVSDPMKAVEQAKLTLKEQSLFTAEKDIALQSHSKTKTKKPKRKGMKL